MDAFLESMRTKIAGIPFWIWMAAIFLICAYFGLVVGDDRPVFDFGGGSDGACGAFGGGVAC